MTADRDDLIAQVRTLQEKWRVSGIVHEQNAARQRQSGLSEHADRSWANADMCRLFVKDLDTLLSLLDGPRRHAEGNS